MIRCGNTACFVLRCLASLLFCFAGVASLPAQDLPPADAFRVMPLAPVEGPSITPFLKYQTDLAWRQDDQRRLKWRTIRTENDLFRLQREMRAQLLAMIGGLPTDKTPLHPQITGRIQMSGFHIEKLIFESLPGVYVTALVYVPDDGNKSHPAILVPGGHSENGKVHYQALCQHLVQHGYIAISWDPVGQGERSQFWDASKNNSRYNRICGEHAILGNLAYLAGANLARWEIWDGIRAVDYLLTRSDVDPKRINIAGTSGGGFQAAHIAALDPRIKVAVPSCYITALPMRVYNRIFKDPDSDPEQDLYGMISNGIDHPGLLLMMYPRPVFVAAAVLDFFPIEGTHKTIREVLDLYARFGHADRIATHEGYHGHEFSTENQQTAIQFLDHFNGLAPAKALLPVKELDEKTLRCTRTGQVMLDDPNAKSVMDLIREYYEAHKNTSHATLTDLYYSELYPGIRGWTVAQYRGAAPARNEIRWELIGTKTFQGAVIDRYLLHHSRFLELSLLYIHKGRGQRPVLFWLGEKQKVTAQDWPQVSKYLEQGYDLVSIDPRGLGETRMLYKTTSPDDATSTKVDDEQTYFDPLSSVLADYIYNCLLTGRPYFFQLIDDVEIATRFIQKNTNPSELAVIGLGNANTLAAAVAEIFPDFKLLKSDESPALKWSDIVTGKSELWPLQYLLPGGAYVR
jgi:pimeloyl-ACP methyl ester carboxylesterase